MMSPQSGMILLLLLLWGEIKQYESVTFNRKRTGVKFLPYIGPDGIDITIKALSTTTENVKAMLEVVSTRFSRVFVDSMDAQDEPYIRNFTYRHQTVARASTPEMAALINRERNELVLTVMVGISLTWSEKQQSETEVRVALEAFEIAESIYPGTVEGFFLSNYELDSLEWAEETHKWIMFLRNNAASSGLPIGTEQGCGGNLLNFEGQNKSDPISTKIGSLRKEIIMKSDFLICFSSPGEHLALVGASFAFNLISSRVLKNRDSLRSINSRLEFMWSTFWTNADGVETQSDYDNMGVYWTKVDNFATANNMTVWLDGAFKGTNQRQKLFWWRLTQFDLRNDVSAYEENYSGGRTDSPKSRRTDISTTTSTTTTEPSPTSPSGETTITSEKVHTTLSTTTTKLETSTAQPDGPGDDSSAFGKYGATVLGLIAVIILSVLAFFIYKRWSSTRTTILTRQEIDEFKLGSLNVDAEGQNDYDNTVNVTALKLPYDTMLEILKTNLTILMNQVLGGGEFGCVYKALLKDDTGTQKEVALKMTKPTGGATAVRGILSEIKILSYLGIHPNIVPILGAYTADIQKGIVYLATELCPLGSLKDCLKNVRENTKQLDRTTIPFNDMLRWSNEIACGMEYLGQKGVIHADLATRNVLLSSNSVAKITDFGLSRRLYEYTNYTKTHQEPLPWRWMAVESLKMLEFSTKSDVWSYGVTLWEIFSLGGSPYPGLMWTIDFVEMLEDGLKMKSPRFATSEIYDVMLECWNLDKDSRPSFTELKKSTRQLIMNAMDDLDVASFECPKFDTTSSGTYGKKMNLYYNGNPSTGMTSFF